MSPRTPMHRRATSTTQPKPASSAARVGSRPELSGAPKAAAKLGKLKKDEFSTGRARALRAKTLGTAPATVGAEPEPATSVAGSASTAAVTAAAGGPVPRTPVYSFDTATYLSIVGNPPTHRITQQQVDTLRRLGMQHGVIGLPKPTSPTYQVEMAALAQEVRLLNANGIRTDTYYYFNWTAGSKPKTDAAVRDELFKVLDGMKGQPVQTFWFDVEFDARLNPSAGVANNQRMLDTAYAAFTEWKQANPDSTLEFGLYTGEGTRAWSTRPPSPPSRIRARGRRASPRASPPRTARSSACRRGPRTPRPTARSGRTSIAAACG